MHAPRAPHPAMDASRRPLVAPAESSGAFPRSAGAPAHRRKGGEVETWGGLGQARPDAAAFGARWHLALDARSAPPSVCRAPWTATLTAHGQGVVAVHLACQKVDGARGTTHGLGATPAQLALGDLGARVGSLEPRRPRCSRQAEDHLSCLGRRRSAFRWSPVLQACQELPRGRIKFGRQKAFDDHLRHSSRLMSSMPFAPASRHSACTIARMYPSGRDRDGFRFALGTLVLAHPCNALSPHHPCAVAWLAQVDCGLAHAAHCLGP